MIKSNPTLFYIILCGIVFLIIVINVSLFSAFRNRSTQNHLKMGKSAFDRAKSPWEPEDRQREELSDLVDQISKPIDLSSGKIDPDGKKDQELNNGEK